MELEQIKGIGEATAKKLKKQKIASPRELLETFPAKYEDKRIAEFIDAQIGVEITLEGTIQADASVFFIRRRLTKLEFSLNISNVVFKVVIFNREFLASSLKQGNKVVISGKFNHNFGVFTASDVVLAKNFHEGIIPIYQVEGLSSKQFHNLVKSALPEYLNNVKEDLPDFIKQRNNLMDKKSFMKIVHLPKTREDTLTAAYRIKYREFLDFALMIEGYRKLNLRVFKTPKKYDITRVREFIGSLPFALSDDQKLATNEIFGDLKSGHPMNRLLQGEVGSGKTIVAILAILAVCTAGYQVAVMAPTEILAWQNHREIKHYLERLKIRTAVLTGSTGRQDRVSILERLQSGEIDVLVGTHALIQSDLDFHSLGLVVIDEQHRFGVKQRQILRRKGQTPDVLLMTATPIPRTLAITLFRDMEISTIRMLPRGRQPIETKIVEYQDLDQVFAFSKKEIDKGRQAYFIVPLISESDTRTQLSLEEFKKEIEHSCLGNYQIGYLHGRQKSQEKEDVLERFYQNEVQILVSTTVVEVGVNVPNATIMVILSANGFGLSQLHQLRGRIGRGFEKGYCYLVSDPNLDGPKRIEILEKETDGFQISLQDLRLRGPGEVFGDEQTGIMRFKMANLILDEEILKRALEDAKWVLEANDQLAKKLVHDAFQKIDSYILD